MEEKIKEEERGIALEPLSTLFNCKDLIKKPFYHLNIFLQYGYTGYMKIFNKELRSFVSIMVFQASFKSISFLPWHTWGFATTLSTRVVILRRAIPESQLVVRITTPLLPKSNNYNRVLIHSLEEQVMDPSRI